jgi:hypothetical protein
MVGRQPWPVSREGCAVIRTSQLAAQADVDAVRRLRDHRDMSDESSPAWEFSDAWFMTAVAIAKQPCDLAEVVAAADGINHAILLDSEVEQAVARLSGSGLVGVSRGPRFALTPEGQAIATRRRGGLFAQVTSLLSALSECELTSTHWQLPSGALPMAVAEYQRRSTAR